MPFCNAFAIDFSAVGSPDAILLFFVFPWVGSEAVEIAFAGAAIFNQFRLLELRKVRGDGALTHGQDLLQLGHRELFAL